MKHIKSLYIALSIINTFEFNTLSVFNLIESIKNINPKIKLYQASSSEMFGRVKKLPITEESLIHPVSPYAISKVAAHYTCVNYRESYGMFISCGILFNHESPVRGKTFVTRKIIMGLCKIYLGSQKKYNNIHEFSILIY